jgi:hypothetical protein
MNGGQLTGQDRIERAEQVELAIIIRGGVTKHRNLNRHTVDSKR